ncbi:ATP-binding protein [Stenotrophomonas sp.]|uniref:ATP-binding protein n=1 Tax=Stenotrophomonas sp. TaxID=69392 RepID=UPI0025F85901|nr:ATP-binding protein [Stenotrophomonas sp.]MBW8374379.1 response regulator [Stenotrophomonas sp.]
MASRASTPSPLSGRHRSAARIIWFTLTLALGGSLLWLVLSSPTARRTPFALAIGPQMASQHGLAGDAAQGGPGAYLEAVEALSGLKLELVRAPSIERAVLLLHNEQVDGLAFSLPSTAAMLPTTAAVSPSFYTGATVMVTRPTAAFRALSVMDGMRVGVIGNGEYRAYLAERHPGIDVYPLPSVDEMLEAVDSGGIDAAIGVDAVLAPLARKRFDERLEVHLVSDGPAVEMRVASLPRRAGEIAMAHQTFLSLPLDTRQDILDRWLTALYRSPPTLRAVLAHYRVHITVLGMFLLAFLLAVAQSQRNARSLASRQASAARILTLVNHEVRNGAASVISAIDLLEAETDPAERNRLFQSARSAADALKHTLTNALEFMFRDMPGQADPAFLQNAEGIVTECLSAMRPLARCKGLHLVLRLEGRYVQQAMCDARALHHIASNLISNAIKFSDHGEVTIRLVYLAGVGHAGAVELSVSDVGPGIPREDLSRIFEPFSATRIGRLKHGAGIGLSLCRRIARAQGGDVTVSSQPGRGSTFVATLRAEYGEATGNAAPAPLQALRPELACALVIEDQPAIAKIMVRRLRGLGLETVVADSGAAAIRLMNQEGPFGIVTVDGDLMDADGSDIALEIRSIERRNDWPPARLLSVSASSDVIDRAAYARAGVDVYLGKPIDWAAFDAASGAPASSARPPVVPTQEGLSVMEIYHHQMQLDRSGLEVSIRVQNWRGALAMAHRMQGAASMVGDAGVVEALRELQQCLKGHAINGDPADARVWALVALLNPAAAEDVDDAAP